MFTVVIKKEISTFITKIVIVFVVAVAIATVSVVVILVIVSFFFFFSKFQLRNQFLFSQVD